MRIRKPCAAQTAGLGNIFSQKNNKGEENETMKKILALVLVLIMALGLAACAAPAAPAEEPTPAAEPETEKVDSQAILAELKTPAEESNWERTTSSQEVIDFLKVVAEHSAGRIILDTTGAEKLVGKGDMLYAPLGEGKPTRVQGCFISPEEIEDVVSYVKETGEANYSQEVIAQIEQSVQEKENKGSKGTSAAADTESSDEDELLPAAVDVVLETGQASVSMLQRRLKLGYSRAARLVDQMEERGIVGPFEGSKPRQLLITRAQWDEMQMGGAPAVEDAPPFDTGDE